MFSVFLSEPLSVLLATAGFFFMIWPGYAVLHLLGFGFDRWPWAPFAGPAVTLALWIIALSGSVWAGLTLQQTAIPVWAANVLLAIVGFSLSLSAWRKASAAGRTKNPWLWLLVVVCVAIPLLIMPATFVFGLGDFPNSTSPDSWSYVAMADYLLTIPRGLDGGLSALHQYAAHLMGTRNATPAILGFLSIGLGGVKVSQAVVLFCLLVTFANSASLVAFSATIFGRPRAAGALVIIIGLGWPENIILIGNFDQLLILPLLPVIAALAFLAALGRGTVGAAIVISLLAAATFYAYVELSVIGLLVAMSMIVVPSVSVRSFIGRTTMMCCIAAPIAIALTWPAASALFASLKSQYSMASASVRPGEGYFPGLVSQFNWFGALWALGPEHLLGHTFKIGNAIGIVLLLATAGGVWAERKRWSAILAFAVIGAALAYFTVSQHYSYAAYKIISVNSWLIGFFVVSGLVWLSGFLPDDVRWRRKITVAAVAGLLTITGFRLAVADKVTNFTQNGIQQRNFGEIQTIAELIHSEPTLLTVRDPLANEWAVFYLADTPMLVAPYRLYMAQAHVIPFMSRAKKVDPAGIRYIVTDRNDLIPNRVTGARRVWEGQVYSLWVVASPDWAVFADVNSPNGLESDGYSIWTWLGELPSEFVIVAGRAGAADLTGMFYQGPKAPQGGEGLHISLTDASGRHAFVIRQPFNSIPISLFAGKTTVTIKVEVGPKVGTLAGGDPQSLMLRMTDFIFQNVGK